MGREIEEFEHIYPEGVLNMFMALANEIIGWQISNCIPRLPIIFDGTSFFCGSPGTPVDFIPEVTDTCDT